MIVIPINYFYYYFYFIQRSQEMANFIVNPLDDEFVIKVIGYFIFINVKFKFVFVD